MCMYLYNIGYASHDESNYIQMWHEEKFSNKKLREKVQESTIKALEYAIEHPEYFVFFEDGILFEELFDRVVVELNRMGFKPVKFTAQLEAYGMARVGAGSEDDNFYGLFEKELCRLVPEELRERAVRIGRAYWEEHTAQTEQKQ